MAESRTAQTAGVNSLAILALVFAFVFAPLGIVLGHLAQRQIAGTGQRGGAIATAALVIGYVILAVALVTIAITLFSGGAGGGGNPSGY